MSYHEPALRLPLRGLLMAAALLALSISSAAAAPSNKNTFEFHVTCPGAGDTLTLIEIDANGNARWIEGTNSVFVVVSIHGEATVDGVTFPIDYSPSEQRLAHQTLTTCFANDTAVRPKTGQVVTVVATVQALLTPQTP